MKTAIVVTLAWLLASAALLAPRWAELTQLKLNELADKLAGFFSPLAFALLFIATWSQRQELGLQRQELALTRETLQEQADELAKTAAENGRQTEILQQTLQTSREQAVFEEHRLRMYYLARFIEHRCSTQSVRMLAHNDETRLLGFYSRRGDLGEGTQSVDRTVESFSDDLRGFNKEASEYKAVALDDRDTAMRTEMLEKLDYVISEAQQLLERETYTSNPLIAARLQGIRSHKLLQNAVLARQAVAA
ncbi:MAG TPA: hypothetical protein VGU45_11930 [Microvirga sp.]|jgi:hypothetical protein|nr:hypothetical protein [Microvirga sp.]